MKHVKKLCQATVKVLLVSAMVFQMGITGVFALEPTQPTILDDQNVIVELLNTNKESYENALEILNEAQELDGNDPDVLIGHIDYINSQNVEVNDDLENLKSLIEGAKALNEEYSRLTSEEDKIEYAENFAQKILNEYREPNTNIEELTNYYAQMSNILMDIGLADAVAAISDNSALEIYVNGLPMDVDKLTDTVYVGNMVEDLEVLVVLNGAEATYEITKPEVLGVGDNEVKITITAPNGSVKEYVYNVVREDVFAAQGDGTDEKTTQAVVTPLVAEPEKETTSTITYSVSNDVDEITIEDDEKEETKTEDEEEYDEELEEEKGLNGFTILLIVAGIALIGFGIYMLFGDKDDVTPKNNKKVSNSSKPKNKNKKRK